MSRPIYYFRCPQCDAAPVRLHDGRKVHCEGCGHQFRSPSYYRRILGTTLAIIGAICLLAGVWLRIWTFDAVTVALIVVVIFSGKLTKM